MIEALFEAQRWIYGSLSGYLSDHASNGDWASLTTVLPLGILFGAVHALTPGHSKTLLASYLVSSPFAVARALAVSGTLAATHVFSAVVIALFATELMTRSLVGAGRAPAVEDLSRGLLVLVGVWFVVRAFLGKAGHAKHEGVAVGFIAGLVPCPLTLFVMVFALSRGVPLAGLAFAAAMLVGIGLTLAMVAVATVAGRSILAAGFDRLGASVSAISRGFDGAAGVLLITFGLHEFIS